MFGAICKDGTISGQGPDFSLAKFGGDKVWSTARSSIKPSAVKVSCRFWVHTFQLKRIQKTYVR